MPWEADIEIKNARVTVRLTEKLQGGAVGKTYEVSGGQSQPMSFFKEKLRDMVLIDRENNDKANNRKVEADFANFDNYLKERTG